GRRPDEHELRTLSAAGSGRPAHAGDAPNRATLGRKREGESARIGRRRARARRRADLIGRAVGRPRSGVALLTDVPVSVPARRRGARAAPVTALIGTAARGGGRRIARLPTGDPAVATHRVRLAAAGLVAEEAVGAPGRIAARIALLRP